MNLQRLLFNFLFFYLILSASVHAQTHNILIVDEKSNSIPYLSLKSVKTGQYLLSSTEGIITIKEEGFDIQDSLLVESLFFEHLKIQIKDLITIDKIIMASRSLTIEEVSVYSNSSLKNILEKLSRNFAEKYAKDYAAKMLHIRTVETNGKYREFCGYQGIFASYSFTQTPVKFFWEDKNKMYAAPLTVMRSDPLMSNKDEVLKPHSAYGKANDDMRCKDGLKTHYQNEAWHNPLDYKRSIEMYTPLNHRQLSNFNYTIADEYTNTLNQRIIVIRFETKPEVYPRKTVIFGIGHLYYNSELEYVERVVMENHQDQYSMFPRWKPKAIVNSATKHTIDIAYYMQDEHIYTHSVSLDVQWVDPNIEAGFYYIKPNSRRNPLKYNLHEYEIVVFSKFVLLDKAGKKKIEPFLPYQAGAYLMLYIADFDQPKWEKTIFPGVNRSKLFKDLNLKNRPLYTQAQKNALDIDYYYTILEPQRRNFVLHHYIQTREKLYPLLYHEKY